MNRTIVARLAETFFRHWVLYLVPFAALSMLGIASAMRLPAQYTSIGTVRVDRESLVSSRTDVGGGNGFTWMSPAQFASQEVNGLIGTDVFISAILEKAGIERAPDLSRAAQGESARRSISVYPSGDNLMKVRASSPDQASARRLAQATIDQYVDFRIDVEVVDSETAAQFFTARLEEYKAEVDRATEAVDQFWTRASAQRITDLTSDEDEVFDRLSAEEELARDRYVNALNDLEAARLAELQAETTVRQSLSVVDPPLAAVQTNRGLTDMATTAMLYVIAGTIFSLAAPVVTAGLSRAVLSPTELKHLCEGGVAAVIPSSRSQGRRGRRSRPAAGTTPVIDTRLAVQTATNRLIGGRLRNRNRAGGRSGTSGAKESKHATA